MSFDVEAFPMTVITVIETRLKGVFFFDDRESLLNIFYLGVVHK